MTLQTVLQSLKTFLNGRNNVVQFGAVRCESYRIKLNRPFSLLKPAGVRD